MSPNRRSFLSTTTALAGAALMTPHIAAGAERSRRDLRVAVVGVNSQGRGHMGNLRDNLVAICDVDQKVLHERAGQFAEEHGRKLDTESDFRKLVERDDIDAISIATPNHTHTLIAITAIEAGKDVYVEKPVSHNVWEGRQLYLAARKHGRVVQCGTQSRSSRCLQQAVKWVRDGGLGPIQYALGTCYKPRMSIGKLTKPLNVPDTIDYDLWCGPAAKVDLYRPKLHYDWHWDFNTGCGDVGNQGIHQMDIARWFLGESTLAPRTLSVGGRVGYDDAGNTPNSQLVIHDYANAPLLFETRGLPRSKAAQADWGSQMDRFRGSAIGVIVQCEEGYVYAPSSYGDVYAYDRSGREVQHWTGGGNHHGNWLDAVAAGDSSRLHAEVKEGHLSSALCHLGNVSHRLGTKHGASDIANAVAANDLLATHVDRLLTHLRANEVDVDSDKSGLLLGAWVDVDPQTERFGSDDANQWHGREYRAGFEVHNYETST